MVPDFRRDGLWTPVSTGVTTFYKNIKNPCKICLNSCQRQNDLPPLHQPPPPPDSCLCWEMIFPLETLLQRIIFFLTRNGTSLILRLILNFIDTATNMAVKAKPQFSNFLKQQGFKRTPEREKVLQEVFATEGHFEAEELAYRLRQKGSRISKATVYRTLPLLARAGLIKEAIHGEKHHHYEHIHEEQQHDHLICLRCGRIVEFEEESLREIEKEICDKHEFRPEKILVEIFGYCKKCR